MSSSQHHNAPPTAIAERQMRTWAMSEERARRADLSEDPAQKLMSGRSLAKGISHLTISREAGAGGASVARLAGERLGWPVYDANLMDQVANRHQESRLMLDLVDETPSNWAYDVWGTWFDRQVIPHQKYMAQVSRMIHVLARAGSAVFVGRGAQFLLPRAKTFAVRIVAPEMFRSQTIEQLHGKGLQEALDWIRRTDRSRHDFVKRFFHQDISDPHLYDLVINVGTLGIAGAVDQILFAVRGSVS